MHSGHIISILVLHGVQLCRSLRFQCLLKIVQRKYSFNLFCPSCTCVVCPFLKFTDRISPWIKKKLSSQGKCKANHINWMVLVILNVFMWNNQNCIAARNEHPHVAPVIHAPSTIQQKYYTEARITCNVTGDPTPNVAWIHNDVRIYHYVQYFR